MEYRAISRMAMVMAMKTTLMRVLKTTGALLLLVTALIGYNYLRHLVYWLPTEDVTFTSEDGISLAGTLLMPEGEAPHAAVVMLHGSGPEDRRGPGYRILSNQIARSGVAVLFYDKRGVGESGGDFASARYPDFVNDAIAAVNFLAKRSDIDASRIGLHTNSEGGWFGPEVAVRTGHVAFIFNRVAPPFAWIDNVLWEVRNDALAAGVPESEIDRVVDVRRRSWHYYLDAHADPSLSSGPTRDAINAELQRVIADVPNAGEALPNELVAYDPADYRDLAAEIGYNPIPFLEQLEIPLLYTFGETDINVPTREAVEFLEAFRRQNDKEIEILVFDGVGHSMAAPRGFLYGGYIPELMRAMRDFYGAWAIK